METVEIVIRHEDRLRAFELLEARFQQLNLHNVWFPRPQFEPNTTEVHVYTRNVDMETAMLLCYTIVKHFEPVLLHSDVWDDHVWNPIPVERMRDLTWEEAEEEENWFKMYWLEWSTTRDEC